MIEEEDKDCHGYRFRGEEPVVAVCFAMGALWATIWKICIKFKEWGNCANIRHYHKRQTLAMCILALLSIRQ